MRRQETEGREASGLALHWPGRRDPWSLPERIEAPPLVRREVWPGRTLVSPGLLFHGQNVDLLTWLAAERPGTVDLVYMDPPYAVGQVFSYAPPGQAERRVRAYDDRWRGGRAAYVAGMAPLLPLVARVLAPGGFVVVHCDWRTDALWRLMLDEVFGEASFRNAIMWRRAPNLGRQAASRQLGRVLDTLLVHARSPDAPFPGPHPVRFAPIPVDREGRPRGAQWDEVRGAWFVTAPRGDYTDESLRRLEAEGRVHRTRTGTVGIKYFLESDGAGGWGRTQRLDTLWDDSGVRPLRHAPRSEVSGYETQKPEALLERILGWMVPEGGTVLDPFAGSGTTLAVAQRLKMRWIGADASPVALHVMLRRLRRQEAAVEVWARPEATSDQPASPSLAWTPEGAVLCGSDAEVAGWGVGRLDEVGAFQVEQILERESVSGCLKSRLTLSAEGRGRRAALVWHWDGRRQVIPEP
ncbi:MAG: site-specific DNA-methyltransferase [Candidatus Sericytochromatia bacterium]|nr:site-specific DNA-methyltransferase [Candidatus Sericytochromatia bacterium]